MTKPEVKIWMSGDSCGVATLMTSSCSMKRFPAGTSCITFDEYRLCPERPCQYNCPA